MNNYNNEKINIMKSSNKSINNNKKETLLLKILFCSIAVMSLLLINTPVIFAQAKGTIPHGLWEVSQVSIEKKTNGKIEKKVYNKAVDVQDFFSIPETWEIKNSKTVILHYADGMEDTIEYTLEGGQLTINTLGAILIYQYSTNGETLTLSITHEYMWNQPDGQVDNIEDKRIITLTLQK